MVKVWIEIRRESAISNLYSEITVQAIVTERGGERREKERGGEIRRGEIRRGREMHKVHFSGRLLLYMEEHFEGPVYTFNLQTISQG